MVGVIFSGSCGTGRTPVVSYKSCHCLVFVPLQEAALHQATKAALGSMSNRERFDALRPESLRGPHRLPIFQALFGCFKLRKPASFLLDQVVFHPSNAL